MKRQAILQIMTVATLCTIMAGCTAPLKKRIATLENTNSSLTNQVNGLQLELAAAGQGTDDLNQWLADARTEADDLRLLLAEKPEPEEIAPGWKAVPGGAMIAIDSSVLFASGKAVLRDESRRSLDAIVSAVRGDYAEKDIMVFGHTDNQPIAKSGWDDNWQLSTERALAVVRYLQKQGVSPKRIAACGSGEYRPRTANNKGPDRARNRRVEIFALDPQAVTGRP